MPKKIGIHIQAFSRLKIGIHIQAFSTIKG